MKSNRKLETLEDFKAYKPTAAELRALSRRGVEITETLTQRQYALTWVCSLIAAGIMIETLFFKFTAAPESVYIFKKMGTEPWMRWVQGIWELMASIALLWPRIRWAGGILTTGAMAAAILSHLTWLGLSVQGDHGLLFSMALVTFGSGFTVLMIHRHSIPNYEAMSRW
jgi:hypothetical protein